MTKTKKSADLMTKAEFNKTLKALNIVMFEVVAIPETTREDNSDKKQNIFAKTVEVPTGRTIHKFLDSSGRIIFVITDKEGRVADVTTPYATDTEPETW